MFLTVVSPTGAVSSISLHDLPSWRIELVDLALPGDEKPEAKQWIAVGLRYVAAGATVLQVIAALHVPQSSGELGRVAMTGLPKGQRVPDKERLRESMRILCNCPELSGSAAEDLAAEGSKLADVYHDLLGALFSNQSPMPVPGAVMKGSYQGWRYAISRERYASVIEPANVGAGGLGEAPQAAPDKPVPPVDSPQSAKQALPLADRRAPPTEGRPNSHRKPPKG